MVEGRMASEVALTRKLHRMDSRIKMAFSMNLRDCAISLRLLWFRDERSRDYCGTSKADARRTGGRCPAVARTGGRRHGHFLARGCAPNISSYGQTGGGRCPSENPVRSGKQIWGCKPKCALVLFLLPHLEPTNSQ